MNFCWWEKLARIKYSTNVGSSGNFYRCRIATILAHASGGTCCPLPVPAEWCSIHHERNNIKYNNHLAPSNNASSEYAVAGARHRLAPGTYTEHMVAQIAPSMHRSRKRIQREKTLQPNTTGKQANKLVAAAATTAVVIAATINWLNHPFP